MMKVTEYEQKQQYNECN